MDASSFYVELGAGPGGSLSRAYDQYGGLPQREWPAIELDDREIISLVNVRVLSQNLAVTPGAVLQAGDRAGGYVAGYRDLKRGRP